MVVGAGCSAHGAWLHVVGAWGSRSLSGAVGAGGRCDRVWHGVVVVGLGAVRVQLVLVVVVAVVTVIVSRVDGGGGSELNPIACSQ